MADSKKTFQSVIKDNPSLGLFLKKSSQFEQDFCRFMMAGTDFNIRFEVRGNKGELIHCRIMTDDTDRPKTDRTLLDNNNEDVP